MSVLKVLVTIQKASLIPSPSPEGRRECQSLSLRERDRGEGQSSGWFAPACSICLTLLLTTVVNAQTLGLDQAVQYALQNQPLLTAQQAAASAAEHSAIAAAQLPDPKLKLGISNLPVNSSQAFTLGQDFMTMRSVGVMQEFPRGQKRELRGNKGKIDAERENLEFLLMKRTIARDVALAWLDLYYSERALELVKELKAKMQAHSEASLIAYRAGRISQAEVVASKVSLESTKDREIELATQARQKRATLKRWIGSEGEKQLASELPQLLDSLSLEELLKKIDSYPQVQLADKQIEAAQIDVSLSNQNFKPDWNLEVSYSQRGPAYSDMVSVQVGIDLPVFTKNRQSRDLQSKQALLEKTRYLREDMIKAVRAEVERLYDEYRANQERIVRFNDIILPQARLRSESTQVAYNAGRGELMSILDAHHAEIDIQLQRLKLVVDAVRTQVQLRYFSEAGEGL